MIGPLAVINVPNNARRILGRLRPAWSSSLLSTLEDLFKVVITMLVPPVAVTVLPSSLVLAWPLWPKEWLNTAVCLLQVVLSTRPSFPVHSRPTLVLPLTRGTHYGLPGRPSGTLLTWFITLWSFLTSDGEWLRMVVISYAFGTPVWALVNGLTMVTALAVPRGRARPLPPKSIKSLEVTWWVVLWREWANTLCVGCPGL